MKVLIAEDDNLSRRLIELAVRKIGHELITAKDGQEALELYLQHRPDVVLSDWLMPGMDGLELCQRIRQEQGDSYTYFIFLTSLGDRDHLLHGMEAGADDYLRKPLDEVELRARLIAAHRITSLHQQLRDLNEQLYQQARIDSLTGTYNRLRLQEDMISIDNRVARYGHTYAVALFDVDHFKSYNDTYGHSAGDKTLCAVARTILGCCRASDSVYRYGGEEFLLLLPEQHCHTALQVANRVRSAVQGMGISHEGRQDNHKVVTISAGVADVSQAPDRASHTVIRLADEALYRAKQQGRNTVLGWSGDA